MLPSGHTLKCGIPPGLAGGSGSHEFTGHIVAELWSNSPLDLGLTMGLIIIKSMSRGNKVWLPAPGEERPQYLSWSLGSLPSGASAQDAVSWNPAIMSWVATSISFLAFGEPPWISSSAKHSDDYSQPASDHRQEQPQGGAFSQTLPEFLTHRLWP